VLGHGEMFHRHPLAVEIVHRARRFGLAGASVLCGWEGLGASHTVHSGCTPLLQAPVRGAPVMVLIIDSEAKINRFLPELADLTDQLLATVNTARVHRCIVPTRRSCWSGVRDWWAHHRLTARSDPA
jgi:PII-like signaling protein